MSRMSVRERRMAVAVVVLALLAAAQLFVVRPALAAVRRLSTKVKVTAQDLARMQAVVARRGEVEAAYESIRGRITSTKSPEEEIIDMLLTVEKAAKEAGVEIGKIEHIKDEPSEYFNLHTVRFCGRGAAEELLKMIYALQDPQLLFKLPELEFKMKDYKLEMQASITRVVTKAETQEAQAQGEAAR